MKTGVLVGIIIAVIIVILLAGSFLYQGSSSRTETENQDISNEDTNNIGDENNENPQTDEPDLGDLSGPQTHTVTISSSGFSPADLTINSGDTVIFEAIDGASRWPATNIHPTHTVYPGSSRNKCGTSEANNIFEACRGIPDGGSYSFTFNEVGDWSYHDHLQPGKGGTIKVIAV